MFQAIPKPLFAVIFQPLAKSSTYHLEPQLYATFWEDCWWALRSVLRTEVRSWITGVKEWFSLGSWLLDWLQKNRCLHLSKVPWHRLHKWRLMCLVYPRPWNEEAEFPFLVCHFLLYHPWPFSLSGFCCLFCILRFGQNLDEDWGLLTWNLVLTPHGQGLNKAFPTHLIKGISYGCATTCQSSFPLENGPGKLNGHCLPWWLTLSSNSKIHWPCV